MAFRFGTGKRIVFGLVSVVALLGALSACGAEPAAPQSPSTGGGAAAGGPVQELKVDMGDFFYEPGDITLKSGKVKFVLTNVGATAHRFAIKSDGEVKWSSRNVGAGREGVLEIELPPGTYMMGCTLGDHEKRGSVGTLTVQ